MKLLPEALELMAKYEDEARDTLFPLLNTNRVRIDLITICKLAETSKTYSYHSGRHSFASLITLEAGVPMETICKMLGHKDLKMTQRYARVTQKKLFEDMDKFIAATEQKNLRAFVHSLDKDDIAFEDIDENFGEEYKLFLKRDQGRIDSYVNHCLLWLNMLMYKAVDRSIIRFNPIAKIGYEKKAAPKMTHISKADFIKMLSTPMADERTELARRCFFFASLTSLSYIDVKKLYPHHISENSEGRKFIRKEREKTGVEFFVPLHPIAEKILSLYNATDDSKLYRPYREHSANTTNSV